MRIIEDDVIFIEELVECEALLWSWYYTVQCSYMTNKLWRGAALCGIHRRPGVHVVR